MRPRIVAVSVGGDDANLSQFVDRAPREGRVACGVRMDRVLNDHENGTLISCLDETAPARVAARLAPGLTLLRVEIHLRPLAAVAGRVRAEVAAVGAPLERAVAHRA